MLVTDPHPQVVDCATAVLRVADVELTVMPVPVLLGALFMPSVQRMLQAYAVLNSLMYHLCYQMYESLNTFSGRPVGAATLRPVAPMTLCWSSCRRAQRDAAANADSCVSAAVCYGRWSAFGAQRLSRQPSEGVSARCHLAPCSATLLAGQWTSYS